MTKLYVLMMPINRKGYPCVFQPFGIVDDEERAKSLTSASDRYYATFQGVPGKWMERVLASGEEAA